MVLLDTGTPDTSGEIYSEDADDGTRFITEELRVRVPSSESDFLNSHKSCKFKACRKV